MQNYTKDNKTHPQSFHSARSTVDIQCDASQNFFSASKHIYIFLLQKWHPTVNPVW